LICVLQFDSASLAVLERMLAAGRLPALAALRERGRHTPLETPAADFAAGAFHTLYSGTRLGDHGLFYPFQFDPAAGRARYATAFEAPVAIWERLARSGLSTLAIDPYESRPPREWRGKLACGVGFRDRVVLPRWTQPRSISRAAPRGPQATEIFGRPTTAELLRLRAKLIAAPERVASAAIRLLGEGRFDLAWITFPAAHLAGHQYWDLSQVDGTPAREERRLLATALEDVYESVDRALGRIVEALPEGTDVIATSAVGMDVNTSRADLLPAMLSRVLAGGPHEDGDAGSIWRLRAAVPARARRAVAASLPDRLALDLTSRLELRGVDLARVPAFAHPADNQGYIRLNRAGRERNGVVGDAEAEAVTEQIVSGLRDFRDPDGSPAVAAVARVRDLYPGGRSEWLPDLSVRWSDRPATALDRLVSDRFGEVRRAGAGSGRSGNHTAGDAWAVLAPGASRHLEPSRPARLEDVAATVAAVAGAEPDGLAGEALLAT
jgi:predicted AlkP superfamily phosphohydrolase/phosphomutase